MSSHQVPSPGSDESFIPASQSLPEITVKGTILALILIVALAAANAYLGLKVGLTIAASIPAAVISMGVLRLFKHSNILENNIVQTAASCGEGLAGGVAYTLPALLIIHYWVGFDYFISTAIAMIGGILGVLFSVPLRRVVLADKTLRFPEGTAIANVLIVSTDKALGLHELVWGGVVGSVIALCQTGLKVLADGFQVWVLKGNTLIGGGLGFAPAMIGAGYIIGLGVGASVFIGVVLGWLIGIPVLGHIYGLPDASNAIDMAMLIWKNHARYVGLGIMMVGGLWAIVGMFKPIIKGILASFESVTHVQLHGADYIPRTERDLKITHVIWYTIVLLILAYVLLHYFTASKALGVNSLMQHLLSLTSVFILLILGFAAAAICAYFAGLVGSSTSPLSTLALMALIISALIFSLMLSDVINLGKENTQSVAAAGLSIILTTLICAVASIANDGMQDLKAGHMVGATPWKQQAMLILGVVVSALVIPLILQLLFDAYGIGGIVPRPDMPIDQTLAAPQAGLMAAVVQGIFTHNLAWDMIFTGIIMGSIGLVIDHFLLRPHNLRLIPMAVGLGIYLPIDTSMPLVIGGVLSFLVERAYKRQFAQDVPAQHRAYQKGLLLASGLVAGSALVGVILAIPFVIFGSADVLRIVPASYDMWGKILSVIVTVILCIWIKRRICQK